MKKFLVLALALSPLFAHAQEYEIYPEDESQQTQYVTPAAFNYCGRFSDTECWGRFTGSYCNKFDGRYTRSGYCTPSGFKDARGEYSCRCY